MMISSLLDSFTKTIFPPRCFGCAKGNEIFCEDCLSRSRRALDVPYPYIISLFSFKEKIIQRAIHAIKYYHRKDLILPLARAVASEYKKNDNQLSPDNWILVPIPMPGLRKLLRGYNQAELIAFALGKELDLPVRLDILKRSRSSVRQVRTKSRSQRTENQKGSFSVHQSPLGMRVILVDDVTTTGATLAEARRMLLNNKAANVKAITIAH